jgi:GTP-binding protein Era
MRYVPEEVEKVTKALADQYLCNFSIFQSMPDHWAIQQLFPIVPLHRLDEEPSRNATLVDITCDSDGKVSKFIDLRDVKDMLKLHPLKEGEPYYDKDALTDRSERFFVTEIIREKILMNYQKEIPYSVEVVVDEFKDEPTIVRIQAIIFVSRESQKGIIIGHLGSSLKKTATEARMAIEAFLGKKVFLATQVKVSKDWRDSDRQLKRFGYIE